MGADPRRVVLVGFMGSGKSTIGPLLAAELGWGFRDLDAWIEDRESASVADIFRGRGEATFRELELQAARAAALLDGHVIAAGGGAFAREDTRRVLQAGALTVWLRCDLEVLAGRIPADGRRPLAGDRATMRAVLRAREPLYSLADMIVDTSSGDPAEAARRIAEETGLKPRAERDPRRG